MIAPTASPAEIRHASSRLQLIRQAREAGATWAQIGYGMKMSGPEAKREVHRLERVTRREIMLAIQANMPSELAEPVELAKLIAVVIREVREELRKLDGPQAMQRDPEPAPASPPESPEPDPVMYQRDMSSTTSASTERASQWDHDVTPPVRAFGFGRHA